MSTDPVVSDVAPLDVSRFPDSCAFEGAAPVARYEEGIRAESERDPWLWRLLPAAVIGGALLSAWEVAGRPVLW
jgi:hypothetical protein